MSIEIIGNRYVLESESPRRGGTAAVHKARDHSTGEAVAVKMLESTIESDFLKEFFLRESESLATLKHPHIVEMKEAGFDEVKDQFYIVLEWIDENLTQYLKANPIDSWEKFAWNILKPILQALAFAHSRNIIHRDVKPSNILVTPQGQPKLSDFGIAKLRDSLRLGLTVRDFVSVPYAAPERVPSPQADLYSLGIMILACFGQDETLLARNTQQALDHAGLPQVAKAFVGELVAKDAASRPINAQVALLELEKLLRETPFEAVAVPTLYHLFLGPKPTAKMRNLLRLTGKEIEDFVVRDLSESPAITLDRQAASIASPASHVLIGQEFIYRAAVTQGGWSLLIHDAWRPSPSVLENRRESSLPLAAKFIFQQPINFTVARRELIELQEQLDKFREELVLQEKQEEARRIFRVWEDILSAQTDLEKSKEKPIGYSWYRAQGRSITFTLSEEPDEDLIDQVRAVAIGRETVLSGIVTDVFGRELILSIERGSADSLPQRGTLIIDKWPSYSAIRRQNRSLNDVRYGRALRSDLGQLLVSPQDSRPARGLPAIALVQKELDEAKQAALRLALPAEDFVVVQGPPGTGKTVWIAELVCQFLDRDPGKKVLVAAQTHIAVDNAIAKIMRLRPNLKIVRVGPAEKVSQELEDLRLPGQIQKWSAEVHERCRNFLRGLAAVRGISDKRLNLTTEVEVLFFNERRTSQLEKSLEEYRELEGSLVARLEEIGRTGKLSFEQVPKAGTPEATAGNGGVAPIAAGKASAMSPKLPESLAGTPEAFDLEETRQEIENLERELDTIKIASLESRRRIADGLGDTNLLRAGLKRIREAVEGVGSEGDLGFAELQALQTEWLQRFGKTPDFDAAYISIANVVAGTCIGVAAAGSVSEVDFDLVIIDESSKATPTEALVPLTRGKRWILVGDPHQLPPFLDDALVKKGFLAHYNLTAAQAKETLFDRLLAGLPEGCQSKLSIQHRMVPEIGDLVSHCFYDGVLVSARSTSTFKTLPKVLPRPVVWYSTSGLPRRRETASARPEGGPSYKNLEEATQIRLWVQQLEFFARNLGERLSVAVITGYAAQRDHLNRELSPLDDNKWQALGIEINSVDAFQGREADVSVYSVTRSNERGVLGFLTADPRLNVALSRGRDALVIFGDSAHCLAAKDTENPFRKVVRYIEAHPESCGIEELK